MQIYVHSRGQKHGPLPIEEVNRQLQAGQFFPDDLAWHEGLPTWIPLRNVQGVTTPVRLAGSLPAQLGVPPPLPPAVPASARRTDPLAICSLVFGILGLICCGFLIPSLAAVICGHVSLVNFEKDPLLEGRGLTIAGLITGYIGLITGLFYLIFAITLSLAPEVFEGVN